MKSSSALHDNMQLRFSRLTRVGQPQQGSGPVTEKNKFISFESMALKQNQRGVRHLRKSSEVRWILRIYEMA